MKNKIKSNIIAGVCMLISCLSFFSCDYLNVDNYFYDMTSLDSVFARKDLLNQYINGAAAYMPDESSLYAKTYDPYSNATDECFLPWNTGDAESTKFLLDELNEFTYQFARWGEYYKGIRKANVVIARIHECNDISDMDRRDYVGKAYFLRAYYYYLLLRQYGPVPIVSDAPYASDTPIENMSVARPTYDECVDYICKNMQTASELLDQNRGSMSQIYHPTKGAALAVMARVRLEQASPWFNGNTFYADWKTEDGRNFISQTPDNSKWGAAAAAAKAVMDMKVYTLHTVSNDANTPSLPSNVSSLDFPYGAGNIDPLRSYAELFNGETPIQNNVENILSCDFRRDNYGIHWVCMPQTMGGIAGLSLSQSLIDDYRMADGREINNSSEAYPYPSTIDESKPIGTDGQLSFSGYQIRPLTAKMYMNREMRFYATIGYCHAWWDGSSYLGTESGFKNIELTYYKDGNCIPDPAFPADRNWTGYTLKKYINPEDNSKGNIRVKAFPIIRYAEMLLNYAEALNELVGSYTDPLLGITVTHNATEICGAFNQVRYRCGLPGITEAEASDQENMRKLIKKERKIEFACEHMRFFDLRRWGDAMEEINKPITGMNVEMKSTQRDAFYTRTPVTYKTAAQRSFKYKMNFFPIHRNTLDKNSKLTQNPGW